MTEHPSAGPLPPPRRSRSRILLELRGVRQIPGESSRRWFYSRTFDLIVWYAETKMVLGFQLCYRQGTDEERAITWREGEGFAHNRVDDGESCIGHTKMTPILAADGVFDRDAVLELFRAESNEMAPDVVKLVIEKLGEYEGPTE